MRDTRLPEIKFASEQLEACHGLLALEYLHDFGILMAKNWEKRFTVLLQAEEVLLGEEEVLLKGLLGLYLFPDHIQFAVLDQGYDEVSSINLIEVELEIKVSFRVSGDYLPNGGSFKGVSEYAIQKIAYLIIELMLWQMLFRRDDILYGFSK